MYLSKLELVGFKSFADKTEFKFTPGFTALVGPNGCGKTNIVDAIRWVLGEQKSSVLRSDLMENVIFNGTQNRKPLGMAEITLTLQNNKNMLPTEYTEVNVTRRLFRSGESHYLLNNSQCRLRDIVDLFMDTGMGADSYSVIELKMVETILSGRPEERRHLIEEAAGVTKYKVRRKEANRKLMQVQQDLLRVYDIVEEVGKQVRSLSRQAAKTKRYNNLQGELKELETSVFRHKHHDLSKHLKKEENIISDLKAQKSEKEKELEEKNTEIARIENEIDELNSKYNTARNQENEINNELAEKNKELAVDREKVAGLEDKEKNFRREVEEAKISIKELNEKVTELKDKLGSKEREQEDISGKADLLKNLRDEKQTEVFEIRDTVNEKNSQLINIQNKINTIKSQINRNNDRSRSLANKREDISRSIESTKNEITQIESKIENEKNSRNDHETALKKAEEELNNARQREDNLRKIIDSLNNKISENRNELSSKKTSLDFLSSLLEADESSKYLMKTNDWKPGSEKILLAEAIGADKEHRAAVDAALGDASRYIIVENRSEAISAFEALQKKSKGKATFLCKDMISSVDAPDVKINGQGVIGFLSELVRTDDVLINAVRAIFGDTLLVDDLQNAERIVKNDEASQAVTLKGELVRKGGILRGGAKMKKEGLSVGKKERTSKLEKEIKSLEKKISGYRNELDDAKKELSSININALTKDVRDSEKALNENKNLIEKLTYKKESLENSISIQSKNLDQYEDEQRQLETENEEIESSKINYENDLLTLREEYNAVREELDEAESKLSSEEESFRNAEKDKIRIVTDIKNIQHEISGLENQISSLKNKAEQRINEIDNNKEVIKQLARQIDSLENVIEKLRSDAAEALNKKDYLSQQLSSVRERLKQHNEDFSRERNDYDKLVQRLYDRELSISESNVEYKHLIENAREKYNIDLEEDDFQPEEDFVMEEAVKQVNFLKEKLSSIGNVNFMALDEYETQNERYQFYNEQIKDLTDSESTLRETIAEINQTAEEKFLKTFDEVNANFKQLFFKLFGEGAEGELVLLEGNPLESDVEIIAKPPGKKPHSIDTISSGEKTLTAIALLFAIYLVKPSPFCILDEVDAPLDDSNIDKFLELLKDFSGNTQFLIVTHNKKTMSAADTLYGITMQETGVSKIVSVRLADAQPVK